MTRPRATEPLYGLLREAPTAHDAVLAQDLFDELVGAVSGRAVILGTPQVQRLLLGIFGCSPYLTLLIRRDPARLIDLLESCPDPFLSARIDRLHHEARGADHMAALMRVLRLFKSDVALLTALCDLGAVWSLRDVTRALTCAADAAVSCAVDFVFRAAHQRGEWTGTGGSQKSGYSVVAMGKHGAGELNYSSDIDLIVFFDLDRTTLRAGLEPAAFFVRATRAILKILQERTSDGYVFRTDLRLRPDPGATQIAISTEAAFNYYESFGQNWERAALIKARAIAGDLETGRALLRDLEPFIWRKYLDFAAIADIHAMKRQIHAFRGFGDIGVAGHNIKLGRGGIREIEFFVQTQQLIAGGRQKDLREPETLSVLERLQARGWITDEVAAQLSEAYVFLRGIEHRLQMLADEQTQTLPSDHDQLLRLARFSGFVSVASFSTQLLHHLGRVQHH